MSHWKKGSIVVIPFPFTDLTNTKKRPALVIADLEGEDVILSQITTSSNRQDEYAVTLSETDLDEGSLRVESLIRTNKIFTAAEDLIEYKVAKINAAKMEEVQNKLIDLFTKR
ncbi:mRNA interferase MazF [Methanolobus vulcani]|uniref:mRNA interferase MazF n=1 Tax=Methanolobus vulcani TaxID=38026 RepID=A0A7Z7AWP7_9EURY|nr:type II toxin-antitoxin system PemK/MazF family toxin [Methanolobus vulcani]SDF66298.1 mRNA interferase MazF [Methanolobus vulcani]